MLSPVASVEADAKKAGDFRTFANGLARAFRSARAEEPKEYDGLAMIRALRDAGVIIHPQETTLGPVEQELLFRAVDEAIITAQRETNKLLAFGSWAGHGPELQEMLNDYCAATKRVRHLIANASRITITSKE